MSDSPPDDTENSSDAEISSDTEGPLDDKPTAAEDIIRGRMPLGIRIAGFFSCLIVVWVFLWQLKEWFATDGKPLNTLDPQGPIASDIHSLVFPVFVVAAVVGVLVVGGIPLIAYKFREKPDDDDEDFVKQTEGHMTFELLWTAAPAVLLAVIGFFTVATIQKIEKPEPDAMKVDVFGQQWWWGFRYHIGPDGAPISGGEYAEAGKFPDDSDNDVVTANELVVPVGREVSLRETSNDVIHSYWIPGLNGKKDAVPGMYTYWKIKGDKPGVFLGQCTEYCGLSHTNMRMTVRVVSHEDFDKWLENQRKSARDLEKDPGADKLAVEGQKQFKSLLCSSCHRVRGINDTKVAGLEEVAGKRQPGAKDLLVSGQAPDLTHFNSRGMFAGAIFNHHYPDKANPKDGSYQLYSSSCSAGNIDSCGDPRDVATPGNPANPMYRSALAAWLRNPAKTKPMAALPEENPFADGPVVGNSPDDGEKVRGMPDLGLSEEQITQLIAYLETLN